MTEIAILTKLLHDLKEIDLLPVGTVIKWDTDPTKYFVVEGDKKQYATSDGKKYWSLDGFHLDLTHQPTFSFVRDICASLMFGDKESFSTDGGSLLLLRDKMWHLVGPEGDYVTLPSEDWECETDALVKFVKDIYFN